MEGLHLLPALYVTESQPWIGSATFAVEVFASSVDLGIANVTPLAGVLCDVDGPADWPVD